MRRFAVTALFALALVPGALAATPDKGTVSSSNPKVEWGGTLVRPYTTHLAFNQEDAAGQTGRTPCNAPACDTFTLTVAEEAPLTITAGSDQTNDVSMRIKAPDGTWSYHNGWSDTAKNLVVKLKKAAKGDYVINVTARVFGSGNPTAVGDTADYKASAVLATALQPVAAPPAAAPAPAPAAQPAPAAKKTSARAACKKKARKIRNAKKRKAALKRCAKKK